MASGKSGQLGDGTFDRRSDVTGQNVLSDARSLPAVSEHSWAITNDGKLYC